jgi:hypothetical protein
VNLALAQPRFEARGSDTPDGRRGPVAGEKRQRTPVDQAQGAFEGGEGLEQLGAQPALRAKYSPAWPAVYGFHGRRGGLSQKARVHWLLT